MADLPAELARRIDLLGSDRESGASEILAGALTVLEDAFSGGVPILPVAVALVRAQPSMASLWNAALEALASRTSPERFERFARRVARAPHALARYAADAFSIESAKGPLRIVTISFSSSVVSVLEAQAGQREIRVACPESRPALEGRRLAARLAANDIAVTLFGDAGIAHALASSDAVVVGADAVGPKWLLNKSGTRMLVAAANLQAVPVYVVATRDKFVGHAVAAQLALREGSPAEIWDAPPPGVQVRNPYFEQTPLELVTGVISDAGVLGAGMLPDICAAAEDPLILEALAELTRS